MFGEKLKLTWAETATAVEPSRLVNWLGDMNNAGVSVRLLPPAGLQYELERSLPVPERLRGAARNLRKLLADV